MNMNNPEKRAVIVGATSGIGREVAQVLIAQGWTVGVAGRRAGLLETLRTLAPERVYTQTIDVTHDDAPGQLLSLVRRMGGMQLFLLSSGIGFQNLSLDADIELRTAQTNVVGFTRMVDAAFGYFKQHGGGQLAVISSIAGTKGLGAAPAYSATKRYQRHYLDALDQLSRMQRLNIRFTDIRPGFVATDLLGAHPYPMLLQPEAVAHRIVKALLRGERSVVIDARYRLLVFFWRLIPRWLWVRIRVK